MKNDSTLNFALVGVHRAAVAVSALVILLSASSVHAADPPVPRGNVSATLNPTTGYYSSTSSTVRLPNGVSVSPSAATPPVVSKYSGGLQQTIPTGITIDAIKKSAPLPAVVRSTTQSVKGAAGRCLKSGRCNVALIVAGEGLSRLFDGLDWVMGEGGKIQKKDGYDVYGPSSGAKYFQAASTCSSQVDNNCRIRANEWESEGFIIMSVSVDGRRAQACRPDYGRPDRPLTGYANGVCQYAGELNVEPAPFVAVPDSEIDTGVSDNYTPEPSDWPALTPELELDDVEITWAPTLEGEPVTTTVFDAEGNPYKVTKTNIWYDFDIRDNPSPKPALDLKTREETETYENGVLTGTTTTTSGASAGSGDAPPPDSPIDCDLFPTACAWFDWTQEEPTEPDTDLSGLLQEVPIVSETYTITGGVAACPAPMVLDLSVFGSREVSYQPLCDLASTMKYLYLALMSFAAAVLLNRSVNRV